MFLTANWRKKYCVPVHTRSPAARKGPLARHPSADDHTQLNRTNKSPTTHHIKPAQKSSHSWGTAGFQSAICTPITGFSTSNASP
jgi:hypothetical protein